MSTVVLSPQTLEILEKRLNVNDVKDIVDRDFSDLTENNDVNRKEAEIYSQRNRGSVRLSRGLFRTITEQNLFYKQVKNLLLP